MKFRGVNCKLGYCQQSILPQSVELSSGADNGPHGPWMVTPLGIGSAANAVTATFESGFLTYEHGGAQGKVLEERLRAKGKSETQRNLG